MNQAIEQAIIDHTNKVWEQALKVGMADERERIIKLLEDWHFPVNQGTYTVDDSVKRLIEYIKG